MGLEFDLRIASEIEIKEAVGRLLKLPGVRIDAEILSTPGLDSIVVSRPLGRATRDRIEDLFGFSPTLTISFPIDRDAFDEDEGYLGIPIMLRLSIDLLDELQADAVLLFNGEIPVFTRIGGRITVNSNYFRDDSRMIHLGVIHASEPMPIL